MNSGNLRELNLKSEYNTDENDIISELYSPCFEKSIKYDRAVGFFRANIYRELGVDLLNFVIKGGKVRIVCSPDVSEQDEIAAREGYDQRGKRTQEEQLFSLLKTMKIMSKNPDEKDCLDMLRVLIETGALELYIASRPGGIYHRKIGKFEDIFGNKVIFTGSGNETRNALISIEDWVNDEDFDLYRNWGEEYEKRKSDIKEKHLENLFKGQSGRTKVRPINEVEIEYLKKFRVYTNYEDCKNGAYQRTMKFVKNKNIKLIKPYPYQLNAINSWKNSNMIGMLSMATGTGKTYTALFAIEELLNKGFLILIVVPTTILINQWKDNIFKIYPDVPVLIAGGGYNWKNEKNKRLFISNINLPKIILSTMATASSDDFIKFIDQAENKVLVADEAHRLGSPEYRKILNLNYIAKLGLSATPERLFDTEGNSILEKEFGTEPIYNLPINSQIEIDTGQTVPILGNFLSNYNYYFYTITLNYEEQEKWDSLTEQIRKIYAIIKTKNSDKYKLDEKLKYLLIERSRIIKKAQDKTTIISKIIKEKYDKNDHWIIYCEDEEQLNEIIFNLKSHFKYYTILKYHSKMPDSEKQSVKEYFENNPSIIVSIRCLDEGVDIPRANGAIILASSKNPRQYIQRRGRVLRTYKGKDFAVIIDVLVEPNSNEGDIPFSIIRSEIARAWDFAQNAQNREILHEIWELCLKHKVEIDSDNIIAFEEGESPDE